MEPETGRGRYPRLGRGWGRALSEPSNQESTAFLVKGNSSRIGTIFADPALTLILRASLGLKTLEVWVGRKYPQHLFPSFFHFLAKAERLACCPALVMILELGNSGGGLKQPGGRFINEQTKGRSKD